MNDDQLIWYYQFNAETFVYEGAKLLPAKPANATEIPVGNIINPIWDPDHQRWVGQDVQGELDKMREENNSAEKPMAQLLISIAELQNSTNASISAIMLQMAMMQSQVNNGTETPTDAE